MKSKPNFELVLGPFEEKVVDLIGSKVKTRLVVKAFVDEHKKKVYLYGSIFFEQKQQEDPTRLSVSIALENIPVYPSTLALSLWLSDEVKSIIDRILERSAGPGSSGEKAIKKLYHTLICKFDQNKSFLSEFLVSASAMS